MIDLPNPFHHLQESPRELFKRNRYGAVNNSNVRAHMYQIENEILAERSPPVGTFINHKLLPITLGELFGVEM